jgi:hypothetical protein
MSNTAVPCGICETVRALGVVFGGPILSCSRSVQVSWKMVLAGWAPMRVWLRFRAGHPVARPVLLLSLPFFSLRAVPSSWLLRKNLLQPQLVAYHEMALCYPLLHTLQTTHNVYVYCIIFQCIVESGVRDPSTPSNIEIGSPTAIGTNNPIL